MADPVSLVGLSFQVVQILAPAVNALRKAYQDGKTVHESLRELESDLGSIYGLTENINRLFSVPSFASAVQKVLDDTNLTLVESLDRALQGCLKEAQKLLDILIKLGLQIRDGRIQQAHLQWRLDRRIDDIDRLKRNFQYHKSSIQLALQLLSTCKQMQVAELDPCHIIDLKNQIGELQKAIHQMSQQINSKKPVDGDEEETKLLGDMKDMQLTSVKLQRRATLRMEHLTTMTEEIDPATMPSTFKHQTYGRNQSIPHRGGSSSFTSSTFHIGRSSQVSSKSVTPSTESKALDFAPDSSVTPDSTSPSVYDRHQQQSEKTVHDISKQEPSLSTLDPITPDEFEDKLSDLLRAASVQHMGINKPFSDDVIVNLANLLLAVGKQRWSERPRLYMVLRLINEVKAMDNVILDGYNDIDFPFSDTTIPEYIQSLGVQHIFLQKQRYVLSERSTDLIRGGRHRHLDKSADSIFVSLGRLGSGGFSTVDKVRLRNRLTLEEYARKRIDRVGVFGKKRKALVSFENEVHNLKRLSHMHLVRFVGSYTDKRYVGIIMQPVANTDLYHHLLRESWNNDELATLRSWVGCLCSALAYLHQNKCRHKDLKPQNILIRDANILIADFGTALDWTESESDITVGPPEAYTKLYVAPEVGLQQPRDASSDVWSLGCVLLEVATVLSGASLQSKSEFFASLDSSSAAYWMNHGAIDIWLHRIQDLPTSRETNIFDWIRSMTAFDPRERPEANQLVEQILSIEYEEIRYARSCCFEDIHSAATSWAGTDCEEEIFETANRQGELTTMSSTDTPTVNSQPDTHEGNQKNQYSAHQLLSPLQERTAVLESVVKQLEKESINSGELETSLATECRRIDNKSESGVDLFGSLDYSDKIVDEQKDLPEVIQNEALIQDSPGLELAIHIPSHPGETFQIAKQLEAKFLRSHQRFEHMILDLRRRNTDWKRPLLNLVERQVRDIKDFNILHVACNFNNSALATEVAELVVNAANSSSFLNERTSFNTTPLHYAAAQGRTDIISLLLRNKCQSNARNIRGLTPLHLAVRSGNIAAVETILEVLLPKAINATYDSGATALHLAVSFERSPKIAEALIKAGCRTDAINERGETALQLSERTRTYQMSEILQSHETPNTRVVSGLHKPHQHKTFKDISLEHCFCQPCLVRKAVFRTKFRFESKHFACRCPNHLAFFERDTLSKAAAVVRQARTCPCIECQVSLDYNSKHAPCGAPIANNYGTYEGATNLDSVAFAETLSLPIAGKFANLSLVPYPGHKDLDRRIESKLRDSSASLSEQKDIPGVLQIFADAGFRGLNSYRTKPSEALKWLIQDQFSARRIHIRYVQEAVEILMEHGASLDTVFDERGRSLLHVAAHLQDLSLLQLLLENNIIGSRTSLLEYFIRSDSLLLTHLLLRSHHSFMYVNPSQINLSLHVAVEEYDKIGSHIPLLLAHGALIDGTDASGRAPLHIAVACNNIHAAVTLLESGANVNIQNRKEETPLLTALIWRHIDMAKVLLSYGADVHDTIGCWPRSRYGHPCAIFPAVSYGLTDVVQLLLEEYGASQDIHRVDATGRGLLHYLVIQPRRLQNQGTAFLILRYNLNVNAENDEGDTPLHFAAYKGELGLVQTLLAHGAKIHVQNHKGLTPLDFARQKRHADVVTRLGGTYRKKWWRSR